MRTCPSKTCCLNPSKVLVHDKIMVALYILSFSKCIFRSDLTSWKAVLVPSRKKLALHLNSITENVISRVCQTLVGPSNQAIHSEDSCLSCRIEECNFQDECCNVNSRPRRLLQCLGNIGLWPITFAIEASIANFQNAVNDLLLLPSGRSLLHDCTAGEGCPLLQEFVNIKASTQDVMDLFEWIDITDLGAEARSEFLLI